ncbi:MAG: hypothetical protein JSU92_02755 [Deltaproteobacteria bacterium]|nr:MAG: hypothetical protein JSU92_02755 [Deltaproteobacteria bacterium]
MTPEDNLKQNNNPEERPTVKGTLLLGLLKYTREKLGPEGRVHLLKSLNDEDRVVFFESADSPKFKKISVAEWYPYRTFKSLLGAIVREVGKGDKRLCIEIGHWSAEQDFDPEKGILKFYTKDVYKGKANLIYRSTPVIWSQMFSKGEIEFETIEEAKKGVLRLKGFPEVTEANCLLIGAWMERATKIISGFETKVETKYNPAIDTDCDFHLEVKDSPKK